MMMSQQQCNRFARRSTVAFTLVEVLVVLAIISALAAVALPVTRQLLADQKIERAASELVAFMDSARNRAIAENRPVGILIERFDPTTALGRCSSVRVRMLTGVPPYTGDSPNSALRLGAIPPSGNANWALCKFAAVDSQLLLLSAHLKYRVGQGTLTQDQFDRQAPIREGDLIELPGGRRVPIVQIVARDKDNPGTDPYRFAGVPPDPIPPVNLLVDMRDADSQGSSRFPTAQNIFPGIRTVPYKVHRRPVASSSQVLTLPRGVALDLNYSGINVFGNNFAPIAGDLRPVSAPDIRLIFGGDGKVETCFERMQPISGTFFTIESPPSGQIFICVGRSEGIRPDSLFATDEDSPANLMSLDSVWIVTHASTGRSVASPFASVTPPGLGVAVTDPSNNAIPTALIEARFLANLADTIEVE